MEGENHQEYVLLPVNLYRQLQSVQRSAESPSQRPAEPPVWDPAKNDRRLSLIQKKYSGGLSEEETSELASLQDELSDFRQKAAPLPLEMLKLIEAALIKQELEGKRAE